MNSPRPKLSKLAFAFAVLAFIAILASFPTEASYVNRAKLIQRVKPYDVAMAELLGEVGEPIGSPQEVIVDDPAAYLPSPIGYTGPSMVSETYLKENRIYPLQLKTVRYVAGLTRTGLSAVLGVSLALFLIPLIRKRSTPSQISASSDDSH